MNYKFDWEMDRFGLFIGIDWPVRIQRKWQFGFVIRFEYPRED